MSACANDQYAATYVTEDGTELCEECALLAEDMDIWVEEIEE